jgi:N-acetylglucosaminyl-diphospho-decaprenol L-rhamnosyltransferase
VTTTSVVVTYNSARWIGHCLDSLEPTPTVVVDNASRDKTIEAIGTGRASVRVLRKTENGGYAVAVNAGAALAPDDDIFIVNPDVTVPPGGIGALEAYLAEHPSVAIAVPRLVYSDGSPQESIRRFPNPLALLARRVPLVARSGPGRRALARYLYAGHDTSSPRPVEWALGAAMLVRRAAWSEVGGMNERFFLYGEDTDWCYRMWKARWEVHVVPEVVMQHDYRRESRRTFDLRAAATRHHWRSLVKLFALHPTLLIGRGPRPAAEAINRWATAREDSGSARSTTQPEPRIRP